MSDNRKNRGQKTIVADGADLLFRGDPSHVLRCCGEPRELLARPGDGGPFASEDDKM